MMMAKQSTEDDPQSHLESPVCAKNSSRMPSGEKVVLWTRLKNNFTNTCVFFECTVWTNFHYDVASKSWHEHVFSYLLWFVKCME